MGPTRTKYTPAKEGSSEPTVKVELNKEDGNGHGPAKENVSPKVRVTRSLASRNKKVKCTPKKTEIESPAALVRIEDSKSLEINASLNVPCETEPPTVPVSTEEPRSPEINVRFADVFEHETESFLKNKEPEKSNVGNSPAQSEAEPPAHPVLNEQPEKPRLGTVLIWGKLFDDWNVAGRPEPRDDKDQVGVDANPNSDDEEQSQNGKVDGEENCDSIDGDVNVRHRKRPYNRRHRTKPKREHPDSELITKTEHLRILRSALRNTMQCKVREVLGLGEGEMAEPTDEISQAIRGATATRKRRGRKCKVVTHAENTTEGEGTAAINPSTSGANNQEENGEIAQDLDDDSMKPRTTYHELIKIALEENPEGMTVSAIYNWMSNRHASFQMDDTRWKNSVRHNLSINPYFEKHTQDKSNGGGHIWKISEKYSNCSQSRPPPMKRSKPVGRPRRQEDEDPEMLRRELNNIMQDAGFGEVKQESVPMDMVEDPLMLTEGMQLYTIEGFAGEPCFGQDGNFAYGDLSLPPGTEYSSFMLPEFSADGGGQDYYLVDQLIGSLDVSGMDPQFDLNMASNINMA